jgi:hypothetical protein
MRTVPSVRSAVKLMVKQRPRWHYLLWLVRVIVNPSGARIQSAMVSFGMWIMQDFCETDFYWLVGWRYRHLRKEAQAEPLSTCLWSST